MSYAVQAGNAVTILHELRNLAGSGTVTGESASNWNLAVYDDARAAQGSITPTVAEVGSSGWYTFTFTVPEGSSGIWTLEGVGPAGDLASFAYTITVTASVNGSSDNDLTTLARVKQRIFNDDTTNSTTDNLIAGLITEVSNEIQEWVGRYFNEATRTEYYDGNGSDFLILKQGPLVSVTGVWEVDYSESGGSRVETLTELTVGDRIEYNLRSEESRSRGRIEKLAGIFTRGQRNWKVTYVAGYATLPEGLVKLATDEVVVAYQRREEAMGVDSKVQDDFTSNFTSPRQLIDTRRRCLSPYIDRKVA